MSVNKPGSLLGDILALQSKKGTSPRAPRIGDRIGFAFSSKDRYDFTLRSLEALDAEGGFDIIWNDGSNEDAVPRLAQHFRFRNARLVEMNHDIAGGPDLAICFGIKRLIELGYDYIGLLENDVVLRPGWFTELMQVFARGYADGLACGAASVRGYESRVLEYRDGYAIDWASGAGMLLFSRLAAHIVLNNYFGPVPTMTGLRRFYAETFGIDLVVSEWREGQNGRLSADWKFTPLLYLYGFASLSTIPAYAYDLQFDPRFHLNTEYSRAEKNNTGLVHKRRFRST